MKKALLFIAMTLATAGAALAEDTSTVSDYAVRRSAYPRIHPGSRAEFRVTAPDAHSVILDLGKKYGMTRGDDGAWYCTTDSLGPGFHYYFIEVDGMRVSDPASETFFGCGVAASGIEIPYSEGDMRFAVADVPHGEISMRRYYSTADSIWKQMMIYLPPCYQSSPEKKYPVLYLQHGGGEDQRGWATQGRTDLILDNLIAQQQAVPMIVVMSDGNSRDFTSELINDCIPLVERTYRVASDAGHRALAGLSMGGIQTLNAAIEHPELFSYVGVFSSGWWANSKAPAGMGRDTEKHYARLAANPEGYNKHFKRFWLSMGGPEDIAYNNCRIMMERFDKIGIHYEYFETPGGHTWPVWRESLYRFAPLLFR